MRGHPEVIGPTNKTKPPEMEINDLIKMNKMMRSALKLTTVDNVLVPFFQRRQQTSKRILEPPPFG